MLVFGFDFGGFFVKECFYQEKDLEKQHFCLGLIFWFCFCLSGWLVCFGFVFLFCKVYYSNYLEGLEKIWWPADHNAQKFIF